MRIWQNQNVKAAKRGIPDVMPSVRVIFRGRRNIRKNLTGLSRLKAEKTILPNVLWQTV